MNPLFRWAGSKRQIVPVLKKYWKNNNTYIEAFAGSACLFFEIEPGNAIINDLNKNLIDTYRVIRNDPYLLIENIDRLSKKKKNYYTIRKEFNNSLSLIEKAAMFFYLNKFCFNGLYRTNKKGEFNVPIGKFSTAREFDYDSILLTSQLLQNVILLNGDFESIIPYLNEGDFVYLDPPFWTEGEKIFSDYQATSFGKEDIVRLQKLLKKIDYMGANFVVSYLDSTEGNQMLSEWEVSKIQTKRFIAGNVHNRRSVYEIIATNIKI